MAVIATFKTARASAHNMQHCYTAEIKRYDSAETPELYYTPG